MPLIPPALKKILTKAGVTSTALDSLEGLVKEWQSSSWIDIFLGSEDVDAVLWI